MRSDQGGSVDQVFERYRRVGGIWGYRRPGVHLVPCPLYHAAPPANAMFAMAYGQSLVLMSSFDADDALALIERHRVTTTHVVPTQMIRLLRLPEGRRSGRTMKCPERAGSQWLYITAPLA